MIDRIRQQARYRPEDLDQLAITYELSDSAPWRGVRTPTFGKVQI